MSFVTLQYEICLTVKFVTGQWVLFLVVPFIAELYLEQGLAGSVVIVQCRLIRVVSFTMVASFTVQYGLLLVVSCITL